MGSSKKQTVGYWYRPIIQFGLCQGPIDAFLQFRGGDRPAWEGALERSGEIYVNAPDLWGGTDSEGGIQGHCDVMFGEQTQMPNAYLLDRMGGPQSAFRGKATLTFKGGRYGAMNPYPKPASFKLRRILKGWDNDVCWYPQKARVGLVPVNTLALYFALDLSGSMGAVTSNGQTRLANMKVAIVNALSFVAEIVSGAGANVDIMVVGWGSFPTTRITNLQRNISVAGIAALKAWVQSLGASYSTYFPAGVQDMGAFFAGAPNAQKIGFFVTDGEPTDSSSGQTPRQIAEGAAALVGALQGVKVYGVNIDLQDLTYTALVDNSGAPIVVAGDDASALTAVITNVLGGLPGMNPAHMIYDSLVSQNMQGEPAALVNAASFTAAADTLFAEGFGLCTKYDPDAESVEEFRARICAVIGASCSRSRVNGEWYLDLIRGNYARAGLPVLTDNDILEYEEEPSILDDAVNQVVVEWFDPEAKEDRSTAPLHALGAIRATGGVISETLQYPEIPVESLALRAGARELRSRATPLKRFRLTCNRTPYAWRIGTYFRLQVPRRGIADMVCLVGEIDTGTLRSGAIPLVAIQDVFGMPSTTYVVEQPTDNPGSGPVPPPFTLLLEAPYVELAGTLPSTTLAALPADAGYLVTAGARPTSGTNYRLYTAAAGEAFAESVVGDWCPVATVVEAAGYSQTAFSLSSQSLLSRVSVGTAAAWDGEIVRVDAINVTASTIVLGRGCADTVPVPHAAGSRLFFYDEWGASDGREYSAGEVVSAKLVSRSGASALTPSDTPALSLTMNKRAARPYPPAGITINGNGSPVATTGSLSITWRHRDRLLQLDQLIDSEAASIGPEPSTRYALRFFNVLGELIVEKLNIAGTTATVVLNHSGGTTMQLYAISDNGESWQKHERTFTYTPPAGSVVTTITADSYSPVQTVIDGGEVKP